MRRHFRWDAHSESRPFERARRFVALGLVGCVLVSCGPSVQVIHEGSVRFEHCYRLDLDPKIAPSHRAACWQAWKERYSVGQSRDRLEYAERRLAQIRRGEPPPGLALDVQPATAPELDEGPVDAHAPPPRMAQPTDGVTARDVPPAERGLGAASTTPPGETCTKVCHEERLRCLPECTPDDEAGACPCDGEYRACMAKCFQ